MAPLLTVPPPAGTLLHVFPLLPVSSLLFFQLLPVLLLELEALLSVPSYRLRQFLAFQTAPNMLLLLLLIVLLLFRLLLLLFSLLLLLLLMLSPLLPLLSFRLAVLRMILRMLGF